MPYSVKLPVMLQPLLRGQALHTAHATTFAASSVSLHQPTPRHLAFVLLEATQKQKGSAAQEGGLNARSCHSASALATSAFLTHYCAASLQECQWVQLLYLQKYQLGPAVYFAWQLCLAWSRQDLP